MAIVEPPRSSDLIVVIVMMHLTKYETLMADYGTVTVEVRNKHNLRGTIILSHLNNLLVASP